MVLCGRGHVMFLRLMATRSGLTRADIAAGLAESNRRDEVLWKYRLKKDAELEEQVAAIERQALEGATRPGETQKPNKRPS